MAYADGCYVGKRVKLELLDQTRSGRSTRPPSTSSRTSASCSTPRTPSTVLEANGATVDRETTVAKIPGAVVEKAMSSVPHEFTLGGRTPSTTCRSTASTSTSPPTAAACLPRPRPARCARRARKTSRTAPRSCRRSTTSRPLAVVSAQDCPTRARAARVRRLRAQLGEAHIVVSIKEDWEARSLIEMAEALAGGRDELRKRGPRSRPSSAP
jgi:trimethylamine:corrinoid methyltransferase-like protein